MVGHKRFELADLRRVPVHVSAAAHHVIIRSSDEGRKLPAALAEILGTQPRITNVTVDLEPSAHHFPHVQHPEGAMHLVITAQHADGTPEHRWLLDAAVLAHQPQGPRHPGFRALRAAQDLLHTYPYQAKE